MLWTPCTRPTWSSMPACTPSSNRVRAAACPGSWHGLQSQLLGRLVDCMQHLCTRLAGVFTTSRTVHLIAVGVSMA